MVGFTVLVCRDLSWLWSPEVNLGTSGGAPVMGAPCSSGLETRVVDSDGLVMLRALADEDALLSAPCVLRPVSRLVQASALSCVRTRQRKPAKTFVPLAPELITGVRRLHGAAAARTLSGDSSGELAAPVRCEGLTPAVLR